MAAPKLHRLLAVLVVAALVNVLFPGASAFAAVGYDEDPIQAAGVGDPAWAVTLIGDELWVGGKFTDARDFNGSDVPRQRLAIINVNTGQLTDGTISANDDVRALENDGASVWIGGDFGTIGGVSQEGLAKWDGLTQTHVPTFDASIDGDVRALKYHRGWLYIGGAFSVGAHQNLIRVDPVTGALDTGFRPDPSAIVEDLDANGDVIVVAGNFNWIGPPNDREQAFAAAAIDWETGAEIGINISSVVADASQTIAISPSGDRIYIGDDANQVYALNANGSLQWTNNGSGNIQALVAETDGVYVGLHDGWDLDGDDHMLLFLRRSNGSVDSDFDITMNGFWGVRELEQTPQGLVAVGEFHKVRNVDARRVAIFRPLGVYTPAEPLQPPADPGDADASESIDLADVQLVLDYLVGNPAEGLVSQGADINEDDIIDVFDALLIAQYVADNNPDPDPDPDPDADPDPDPELDPELDPAP